MFDCKSANRNDRKSVGDEIQALRAKAALYQQLASGFFDRRTADEVIGYAREMETEALHLEAELNASADSSAIASIQNWFRTPRVHSTWRAIDAIG